MAGSSSLLKPFRAGDRLAHPHGISLLLPSCLLFFLFSFPAPESLKAPTHIENDKGSITVRDTNGKQRWSASWTMESSSLDGRPAVRFTETGRGQYSPYTTDVTWTIESVWSADGSFSPRTSTKTFRDAKGNTVGTETKTMDRNGNIRFERRAPNNENETKTFKAPPDTLFVEGIAGVLRQLPFQRKTAFPMHLLSNEPKLYEVTFEPRGRETVRTPAGEFDCYKIEVVPHLGALSNLAKLFAAKSYFWFTVAAPHVWVRYEGYENGPGTPRIRMEMGK